MEDETDVDHPDALATSKTDPGNVSLGSLLAEIAKLSAVRAVRLPASLFTDVAPKVVAGWRARTAVESPSHLLGVLEFRSSNTAHRPVIEALELIVRHAGTSAQFYPAEENRGPRRRGAPPSWWRSAPGAESASSAPSTRRACSRRCAITSLQGDLGRRLP